MSKATFKIARDLGEYMTFKISSYNDSSFFDKEFEERTNWDNMSRNKNRKIFKKNKRKKR